MVERPRIPGPAFALTVPVRRGGSRLSREHPCYGDPLTRPRPRHKRNTQGEVCFLPGLSKINSIKLNVDIQSQRSIVRKPCCFFKCFPFSSSYLKCIGRRAFFINMYFKWLFQSSCPAASERCQ